MEALQVCRRQNAKRFANLCIDLGGVYVKIGQIFVRTHRRPFTQIDERRYA